MSDPLWDNTVLVQGAWPSAPENRFKFYNSAPTVTLPTSSNACDLSTEQAKFLTYSHKFDGAGWIEFAWSDNFNLNGKGTAEVYFYFTTVQNCVILYCGQYGTNEPWSIIYENGKFKCTPSSFLSDAVTINANTWYHVALSSDGTNSWWFLDGQLVGSKVGSCFPNAASRLWIGGVSWSGWMKGYVQGVRVTKGVARYTTAFTLPTEAYWVDSDRTTFPTRGLFSPIYRIGRLNPTGSVNYVGYPVLVGRKIVIASGGGSINGTVKKYDGAVTVPLRRRVRLFEQSTGLLIQETWSDAVTGAYSFTGLDKTKDWIVMADDWQKDYCAVAADWLRAE